MWHSKLSHIRRTVGQTVQIWPLTSGSVSESSPGRWILVLSLDRDCLDIDMTKPCSAWLRYLGGYYLSCHGTKQEKPLITLKFHTSLSQTNLIVQIVHGWLNLLCCRWAGKQTRRPRSFRADWYAATLWYYLCRISPSKHSRQLIINFNAGHACMPNKHIRIRILFAPAPDTTNSARSLRMRAYTGYGKFMLMT